MAVVGEVFGDWLLLRLLGKGTYSRVFLARNQKNHTEAAVKVMDWPLEEGLANVYVKQKQRLMGLHHSHLVRILEVDAPEGRQPFLVMEYAPHGTLRARHPPGEQVPLEVILAYLQQIVPALHYLHRHRLVHGDIKPGKFLVERDGRIVVGDAGPPPETMGSDYGSPSRLREALPYMAPERKQTRQRILPRHLEQAADQYSLGAVVYAWLAGKPPFPEEVEIPSEGAAAALPPSLHQIIPLLPKEVEDVVFKALENNPEDRYADVTAFAQAFEQACLPRTASALPKPDSAQAVTSMGADVTPVSTYQKHTGTITSLAWSPDGRYIASASGDRTVQVWDAETGAPVFSYTGHQAPVLVVAWSPKGNLLASGSVDGTVQVWGVASRKKASVCQLGFAPVSAVAWSPDGEFLAVGVENEVQIRHASAPCVVVAQHAQRAAVKAVAWSPAWPSAGDLHTATLASGDEGAKVEIWSPGVPESQRVYERHHSSVGVVAWSPDGAYLASGGGQTVQVWRVADFEPVFTTPPSRAKGRPAISWQPQHAQAGEQRHWWLAVTGFEATVEVWDVLAQKQLGLYTGHAGLGLAVAWSPDGTRIASGGFDQHVQVWRLA
jgi:WD40 repeat protein